MVVFLKLQSAHYHAMLHVEANSLHCLCCMKTWKVRWVTVWNLGYTWCTRDITRHFLN